MKFKRMACPRCGAKTEKQAENMCKPKRDHTGEYDCPAAYWETDMQGWLGRYTERTNDHR